MNSCLIDDKLRTTGGRSLHAMGLSWWCVDRLIGLSKGTLFLTTSEHSCRGEYIQYPYSCPWNTYFFVISEVYKHVRSWWLLSLSYRSGAISRKSYCDAKPQIIHYFWSSNSSYSTSLSLPSGSTPLTSGNQPNAIESHYCSYWI